jgi:hypothetical protein
LRSISSTLFGYSGTPVRPPRRTSFSFSVADRRRAVYDRTMADAPTRTATSDEKLIRLNTHQAQNLEALKNDAQWLRGRVEAMDQRVLDQTQLLIDEARGINRKLWHLVLWLYIGVVCGAIAVLMSLVIEPY